LNSSGGDLVTYEPVLDGPDGRPNLAPDAAAAWPVLARLPWVGEPAAVREEPRARHVEPAAEPMGRREAYSTPSLRIAEMPAEPSRKYIDHAHRPTQPAPPAQHYEAIAGSVAAEPVQREAASRQRRHRIDPADVRQAEAMASTVRSHLLPLKEPNTLAAQVFQWHAAATPYAGVVLTFLLAFSGGLLYWFTIGRPQAAPANDGASAPIWTSESLDPTTVARDSLNSPGMSQEVEEFSWSQRDAAKPLNGEVAKLDAPPLGAELSVEKVEAAGAAPLAPSKAAPASAAVSEAPVAAASPAPTAGAASNSIYPTTPYAAFDFGLLPSTTLSPSVAGVAVQDAVAGRPAEGIAPQPSTR
jgi:hypothetical protein